MNSSADQMLLSRLSRSMDEFTVYLLKNMVEIRGFVLLN